MNLMAINITLIYLLIEVVFFEFINASEEKDIIHNVYVLNHDGTLKKL